ncbi:MAG: conjugal transfer protein TraF [Duodenibacillus sp.]|nr:conjugal transfer protein TraF [Duodenibacillus sp.]
MRSLSYAAALALAALACAPRPSGAGFFHDHARGWYWYEIRAAEEDPPGPPAPEQAPPAGSRPPAPLTAEWVRAMLPRYKALMWSQPTPENIRAYFLMQKFAVDRSAQVARMAQEAVLGDAALDAAARHSPAGFAKVTGDVAARGRADAVLARIAGRAGLFFFFQGGCPYCEKAAPVIAYLERRHGIPVVAVSVDGGSLASARFARTRRDAGQAALLGVTRTPALFLASPEGGVEPVAQGLLDYESLRTRIILAAHRKGWISDADLRSSEHVDNPEAPDLSRELPALLAAAAGGGGALADADGFIAPARLAALLAPGRDAARERLAAARLWRAGAEGAP